MRPSKTTTFTLFEHLEELRSRIIICLAAVFAATAASYFYSEKLLEILLRPVASEIDKVYFFSPADAFLVRIKVSFLAGILVSSPVVLSQLWFFVSPALRVRERRIVIPLCFLTSALFLSGAFFCFYFVLPLALKFLVGMQTQVLRPMISIDSYVSFLSGMLLAFGVAFNVPVLILVLVFAGVLSSAFLNRYQRHAILLIFIAAAVLTPGPDIASQISLAVPLLLLFEMSVVGAKVVEFLKKR